MTENETTGGTIPGAAGLVCEHCMKREAIIKVLQTGVLLCKICFMSGKF